MLIRCDPLHPPMLRSRRPMDPFSIIIRPGWERLKLEAWLDTNDPWSRSMSKLVRDRIPDIIRAKGETPDVRRAEPGEMPALLGRKLVEEATEFAAATDRRDRLEELADVLEVVDTAARANGSDFDTVLALAVAKRETRGGFNERWVWTPTP